MATGKPAASTVLPVRTLRRLHLVVHQCEFFTQDRPEFGMS